MTLMEQLEGLKFFHNSLLVWLQAFGAAGLGFLLTYAVVRLIHSRLQRRLAGDESYALTEAALTSLGALRYWLLALLVLTVASHLLILPRAWEVFLGHMVFALVGLQLALWANALISLWLTRPADEAGRLSNPVLASMLTWAIRLTIWVTLLLAFLANVGVNITAFVASLGIGGVAVALALQTVLGDLFSSIAIGLDKPFEVGQFIAFGKEQGTVEHVGIKTTRINSLSGEQLVIANSNLLKELVRNYSRMSQRRIVFGLILRYGTTRPEIEAVVMNINQFIALEPQVRFDRGHLVRCNASGLELEFVYFVLDPNHALYMDIQQRINLQIVELMAAMSLEFAGASQTVRISATTVDYHLSSDHANYNTVANAGI